MLVNQTNKTLLFDELNPRQNNILTYINEKQESISDYEIKRIYETLAVKSFDDCLSKFQPEIQFYVNNEGDVENNIEDEQKDKLAYRIIFDNENKLLNFCINIFENNREDLSLHRLEQQMLELLMSDFQVNESISIIDNVIKGDDLNSICELFLGYDSLLNDSLRRILIVAKFCELAFSHLEVKYKYCAFPQIESDSDLVDVLKVKKEKYTTIFCDDSDKILSLKKEVSNCLDDTKVVDDLMDIYIAYAKHDEEEINQIYARYLEKTKRMIKGIWNLVQPVLSSLMGIYSFFAIYGNDDLGMMPQMIITNLNFDSELSKADKDKLDLFLKTVNEKNDFEYTIWYGILPNVSYQAESKTISRKRFYSDREYQASKEVGFETVEYLNQLCMKYQIQLFCCPSNYEKTRAAWATLNGVEEWVEWCSVWMKNKKYQYLIPCFPNFSLGRDYYKVDLNKINQKTDEEQNIYLKVVGIDAAFVAAGMYAAVQSPGFLKKCFKEKVNGNIPGVNFDITENENFLKIKCNMKASSFPLDENKLETFTRYGFGVLFDSMGNDVFLKVGKVCFSENEDHSICGLQTVNYIQRVIRNYSQDYKKDLLTKFFGNSPKDIINVHREPQGFINDIIRKNEKIRWRFLEDKEECNISIEDGDKRKAFSVKIN